MHRPEPSTRPLPAIVEQATTCHREVRELRDPPSSVLAQATTQRNQDRMVTENLTKRRSDLLNRTRAQPYVKAAWTTDGRIVCLLEHGEKRSIVNERDLDLLHRHQ